MLQKTLEKLICFKTVSQDRKENLKALRWVKSQTKNLPVYIKELNCNGFTSLVITTRKTKNPVVWLAAHMDVSIGPDKIFTPRTKGGKLFGRGSFDMKFAVACYLEILKKIGLDLPKYDFGVMITSDEELGGENGTNFILNKGFVSKACFLPDGGEGWHLERASKGVWSFKLKSYGKSVHPSVPWTGINAVEELMDFLIILKGQFKKEPCKDPCHIHSTMDVNEINSGRTGDNIPDYTEAYVDIFFTSQKEYKKIVEKVKEVKRRYKKIKMETIFVSDSFTIPINNRYVKLFCRIAYEKFGIKKRTVFSHGVSDTNFFADKKIPIIEIKSKGGGCHSDNEWIDLKDLEKFCLALEEFVKQATKI